MRLRLVPVALVLVTAASIFLQSWSPISIFFHTSPTATNATSIRAQLDKHFPKRVLKPRAKSVVCPNSTSILRIIAAGLGRSGSTWQFNVLYVLLKMAGYSPVSAHGQLNDNFDILNQTLACNVSVIKVHQFHPELLRTADYVFTSHRDPRDAVVSLIELGAGLSWHNYWQEYVRWSSFSCYDMRYEEMWVNPLGEIDNMAKALGLKGISAKVVYDEVDERLRVSISANRTQWDKNTGFYTQHIRDPAPGRWKKNVSRHGDDVFRVEEQTRDWMLAHGYKPWFPVDYKIDNKSATRLKDANGWYDSQAILTAPPPVPSNQRCPLSMQARETGAQLPAGTLIFPVLYSDTCEVLPLYCDSPFLFFGLVFVICFVVFFVCCYGCLLILDRLAPPARPPPQQKWPVVPAGVVSRGTP